MARLDVPLRSFVSKLARRGGLAEDDHEAFLALPFNLKRFAASATVVADEGKRAQEIGIVTDGFVVCYKIVAGSTMQPTAFALPGDAIDLGIALFQSADVRAYAAAPSSVAFIQLEHLHNLLEEHPRLMRALWADTLVDAGIARQWMANIAQRRGREKIGHLLLELDTRFNALGLAEEGSFELPLTQNALACALGLSLVHFNKCYASLRAEGLVQKSGHRITLLRRDRFLKLTRFDPSYLHFGTQPSNAPSSPKNVEALAALAACPTLN